MAVTGAQLIEAERARQLTDEGFSAAHDACRGPGELALAAAAYATGRADLWPWPGEPFKLSRCTPPAGDDPLELLLHDLVRAGALIAAEIDWVLG